MVEKLSGAAVQEISLDVLVKFVGARSKPSWALRSSHVVVDDDFDTYATWALSDKKIAGLRPPMCRTIFFCRKMRIHGIFWCICNHYDFTTPNIPKCCSICYRLAIIWKGSCWDLQFVFGGVGVLGDRDLYQSKAHPRLPNTSQYKVLLYLLQFGRNYIVKLWP